MGVDGWDSRGSVSGQNLNNCVLMTSSKMAHPPISTREQEKKPSLSDTGKMLIY